MPALDLNSFWPLQTQSGWETLAVGALLSLVAFTLRTCVTRPKREAPVAQRAGGFKRAMEIPGKWEPQDFVYPEVKPVDFSLLEKNPPRYRPFRWGPVYHVTMVGIHPTSYAFKQLTPNAQGLRSMQWPEWIQLDRQFPEFMAERERRAEEQGSELIFTLPQAQEAALEIALELSAFLVKRYPELYTCHPAGSERSVGGRDIQRIECKLRRKSWTLQSKGGSEPLDDPMTVVGKIIQDDAYIMMEREDGLYYLSGGAGLTPGFWRLKDKIGMQLKDVHVSSDVPYFKEKLQTGMERFFAKLPVDKPGERNNYFFQLDDTLAWNYKMMGPEKYFVHKEHAPDPAAVASGVVQYEPPKPIVRPEDLRLRSERQTLRRMPRTGAVLFTVRTYITPLEQLAREPKIPGRFAAAMQSWDPTVAAYKGKEMFAAVVIPYLDAAHEKQVAEGIVAADDKTHDYPY